MFSVTAIDPRYGRFVANKVVNGEHTEIPMVDCRTLMPDLNDL